MTIPILMILVLTLPAALFLKYYRCLSNQNKSSLILLILFMFLDTFLLYRFSILSNYPISVHMSQHILTLLILPPLLLSSAPTSVFSKLLENKVLKKILLLTRNPLLAYSTGMVVMWAIHIPMLTGMESHHVNHHHQEVASYGISIIYFIVQLFVGIIYSMPVFIPLHLLKLAPLQRVLYLFLSCLGCSILGIFISMNGNFLYLKNEITASEAFDMELGGLIMWVPGCLVYITKVIVILADFFNIKVLRGFES